MSDGTKSEYTKTGEKVMCINSNRRDLTYKKVYDVFTTQDSVYFIIDDVGDKRYESLEFPYWCEKPDGMVDKANETKPKSKVGDKETGAIKDIPEQYRPRVFLADENDELEDVTFTTLVGNGSKGVVQFDVNTNSFGTFAQLSAIKVENLVKVEGGDTTAKFNKLGKVKGLAENPYANKQEQESDTNASYTNVGDSDIPFGDTQSDDAW